MTDTAISIRRATGEDIDSMASLLGELFSIETDFTIDNAKQRKGLRLLLDRADAAVFVAETDGVVCGMCTVQTFISTAEGGKSGLLEDVIVTEKYRGSGIGSMLLGAVESWAEEQQITRLELLTDRRNTSAIAFYTGHAWKTTNMICMQRFL